MDQTCSMCSSDNTQYLLKERGFLVCNDCNAIFSDKIKDNRNVCFTKHNRNEIINDILRRVFSYRYCRLVSNENIKYLKSKTSMKFKTALDIGALYGIFVKELSNNGIDAEGIEFDKNHIKLAVTKNIQHCYFDENYSSDKKYDLICFTQMLYYSKDPIAVLKHAKSMLNENGLIFITTENPQSSLIRNMAIPSLLEDQVNVFPSIANFQSLEKIGLKMIDYTVMKSNIQLDRVLHTNEIIIYMKYLFRNAYIQNPDGNHIFLLLANQIS